MDASRERAVAPSDSRRSQAGSGTSRQSRTGEREVLSLSTVFDLSRAEGDPVVRQPRLVLRPDESVPSVAGIIEVLSAACRGPFVPSSTGHLVTWPAGGMAGGRDIRETYETAMSWDDGLGFGELPKRAR